jgi:ribosome-binding factor A
MKQPDINTGGAFPIKIPSLKNVADKIVKKTEGAIMNKLPKVSLKNVAGKVEESVSKRIPKLSLNNVTGKVEESISKHIPKVTLNDVAGKVEDSISKSIPNVSLDNVTGKIGDSISKSISGIKMPSFKNALSKVTENKSIPKINYEVAASAMGSQAMDGVIGTASSFIKKFPSIVQGATVGFMGMLVTVVIIILCLAILVLIYIIVRVIRVRGFMIGHSEKLEEFMEAFHNDMNETRKLMFSLNAVKDVFSTNSGNMIDLLKCPLTLKFLSQEQSKISSKFDTYFKYYDIMGSSLDKWFYSNEITSFEEGGRSGDKVLTDLVKEIDDVRAEVKRCITTNLPLIQKTLFLSTITEEDYKKGVVPNNSDPRVYNMAVSYVKMSKDSGKSYDTFKSFTQQFIDLCIGFSVINLYLSNYFDDIKELHNSRRFSFYNFLIILLKPYVTELILNNVVTKWKRLFSSRERDKTWKEFKLAWSKIGDSLGKLPKTLANSETFTDNSNGKGESDEDIIEGFAFLKGLMSIGQFFLSILEVAMKLAELIANPLDMLFFLFKMIFGLAIGLVLVLLYALFSIPPFTYIIYGIYFFIFKIVVLAVLSCFYIVLFAAFAIIGVILWVLDLILGGFSSQSIISKSMRCENLPDVWYTRANVIHDNHYTRAFVCQAPCSSRFTPTGLVCRSMDTNQPSYCPQAQVYRIYKGLNIEEPHSMGEFKPSLKFYSKTRQEKEDEISSFFLKRQEFFSKCSEYNDQYDYVIKTICSNPDYVKIKNEKDRDKLKRLCKQIYCYGNPKEEFCYKYDDVKDDVVTENAPMNSDDVLRTILKLIVAIIISLVVILMLLYNA